MEKNKTWEITQLPAGKTSIASKWIYNVKYTPVGDIDRFKARLVAKGYNQQYGVDFYECFSPAARTVTIRTMIFITTMKNWEIHQIDINNAYLHGFLGRGHLTTAPFGL